MENKIANETSILNRDSYSQDIFERSMNTEGNDNKSMVPVQEAKLFLSSGTTENEMKAQIHSLMEKVDVGVLSVEKKPEESQWPKIK